MVHKSTTDDKKLQVEEVWFGWVCRVKYSSLVKVVFAGGSAVISLE